MNYELMHQQLRDAIQRHYDQKADDRCWMDDAELYKAAGLPPKDFSVGDKYAILKNCVRYIEKRCEAGRWPSYLELERRLETAVGLLNHVVEALNGGKDARPSMLSFELRYSASRLHACGESAAAQVLSNCAFLLDTTRTLVVEFLHDHKNAS